LETAQDREVVKIHH